MDRLIKLPQSRENPWRTQATRGIYENEWIKVEEDQVLNPTGGNGIYGRVHFKNRAIGIIPIDSGLNTWLVGQYRYPLKEYSWEIPMGGSPLNQEPLKAAQRELKEETGLTATKWTNILKVHTSNSVTDEVGYVFWAEELSMGEVDFEDTEDLLIQKLPLASAIRLAMEGAITDGISLAGLLKTAQMLNLQIQPD